MRNSVTILLVEPDSYKDIVLVYEKCLKKAWIDPPPVLWANEAETISSDIIHPLNCGGDPRAFCGRLKRGAEAAGTKWIIYWNADILPTEHIESEEIDRIIDYMQEQSMKYCMLVPAPKNKMQKINDVPELYLMDADRPYSLSFSFCLIDADYLKELIKDPNWTGWQLEGYGLQLAHEKKNDRCLYHDGNLGATVHLIRQSKIIPKAAKELSAKGIDISSIHREMLSKREIFENEVKGIGGRYCPMRLRKTVKRMANAIGIKTVSKY